MASTYRSRRAIRPAGVSCGSLLPIATAPGVGEGDARALLALIPAMLFTARPDGTWDDVSPPFCAYTGLSADALTGLGWVAALHPDDQSPTLALWRTAIRSGPPWQIEHRLRGGDDVYRWFRTECVPRRDVAGTVVAWVGITLPLESERQLAAERLLRRQAEQERDTSEVAIATVAHELRAPLTVLLGQAKLLERRLESNPNAGPRDRLAATTLVEQALRLSRLLSALMDTALIDHGQLRITATTLDVGALVRRVVEGLQPTMPTHTLQLHAGNGPLWVQGDALRLEQVLHNLIQNAVKYSPAGSTITVVAVLEGSQVQISVRDQGIGIPASVLPTIFRRFARAHIRPPHPVQGMGLGLYLSKAIMELHAGRIDVQSVEGEGCTVTLLLPRIPPVPHARTFAVDEASTAAVVTGKS